LGPGWIKKTYLPLIAKVVIMIISYLYTTESSCFCICYKLFW